MPPPSPLSESLDPGLVLSRSLDFSSLDHFASAIRRLIAETDATTVIVDCHNLHYIDGAGLGAIATAHRQALSQGKALKLRHCNLQLQKILTVGYLDGLITRS